MSESEGLPEGRFLRQLDFVKPGELTRRIDVIGAGAIGSAAVLTLAKMGCSNISVWDGDCLEEHNVSNQMCIVKGIGKKKVTALYELVETLTGVQINPIDEFFVSGSNVGGIVVSAVDSMAVRKTLWDTIRTRWQLQSDVLIDGRMGGEFARLLTIDLGNKKDVELYEKDCLYSDKDGVDLPCSAQSIIYCPGIIGNIIALQVKKLCKGEEYARDISVDIPNLIVVKQ